MEFKDRLRAAREKANLTQAQLAEMAGMTQTTISDLERGKSSGTSFSARIANICGVSALWLESGEGDEDVELAAAPLPQTSDGIQLRDYFAAKALPIVASYGSNADRIAKAAYELADAMLRARKV